MDTSSSDTSCATALDPELITLGVASIDTQGGPLAGEEMGGITAPGISQD